MCYRDTISIQVVQVTPGKQIIIKVLEFSLKKYFFLNYSFLNDDDLI